MVSGIVMDGLIGFRIRFIDENLFIDSLNDFVRPLKKVLNNYKITCPTPYLDIFYGISYHILIE